MSTRCLFWALKLRLKNPYQKLILVSLADVANDKQECWPSHQYLADLAGCSRSSVIRHLKALEKAGLIKVKRRSDEAGMKSSNVYYLPLLSDVSQRNIDVSERHRGSVTVTQGGSVTVTHNTPTSDTPIDTPTEGFDIFWHWYPRKEGKSAARKAWDKIKPDRYLLDAIIDHIQRRKATGQWTEKRFIPHASTFLNGERWEDEITPTKPDFTAIAHNTQEIIL